MSPGELDLSHPALHLSILPRSAFLVQLPASHPLPPALLASLAQPHEPNQLISLAFTSAEVSLILPAPVYDELKPELAAAPSYREEGLWTTLRVAGPMELHMTGVMARLTAPLKEASVAVFATSTWDTDYLMVHSADQEKAVEALKGEGWVFDEL